MLLDGPSTRSITKKLILATFGYRGATSPGGKLPKKEIIMLSKSEVTIHNGSTEMTDVRPPGKESAAEMVQVGQQGEDDNQGWSWFYHCDEVISDFPIGLA
jgi:hypothetical protein